MKVRHTSYYLDMQSTKRLRQLALQLGYVQRRGAGAHELGSISQLLSAIADGHLVVVDRQRHARLSDLEKRFANVV